MEGVIEVRVPTSGATPEIAIAKANDKVNAIKLHTSKIWVAVEVELEDSLNVLSLEAYPDLRGYVTYQERKRR